MFRSIIICVLVFINLNWICTFSLTKETLLRSFQIDNYTGEFFPKKYLDVESTTPSVNDIDLYLNFLNRTVRYFATNSNTTDCNVAVGLFFMKIVLIKTLEESDSKIPNNRIIHIKKLIEQADLVIDSFYSLSKEDKWLSPFYRIAVLMKNTEEAVYSVGSLRRNDLKKWILWQGKVNDYVDLMDAGTFTRVEFTKLLADNEGYFIQVDDSDYCLTELCENPIPINRWQMRKCITNEYCAYHMTSLPAIGYSLSHKYINNLLNHLTQRCYVFSEEIDGIHMDVLCAFMYREAVYLARKGYFARDLFMEHIATCGILGYEEFFRRHWFHKITSWIDEEGCMMEDHNTSVNVTAYASKLLPENEREEFKLLSKKKYIKCQTHPMVLSVVSLAHAVRQVVHYLPEN